MKGITYTQVAQYCVLIFAYLVPAIFISILMTGNPIPQLGFGDTLVNSDVYLLDKLDKVTTELGFSAYTENIKSNIDIFCITAALMFGTAGLPHVIVRFFTVPKVSDARKSAGYALIFIAILYSTAPAVSAFARMNFIDSVQEVQYEEAPSWFKNWENIGLIAWKDKNNDKIIQYSAGNALEGVKPNFASERGLSGERLLINNADYTNSNEVYIDRDIIVLANPEIAQLPGWVIALIAAGALAAALSTAAGLLLVISASISHDVLKKTFMPQITEKQELLYARCSAAVAILIAGLFGIYPPGFVAQVVAFAFGLAAATIFPALLMGIFYKRLNKEGAIAGMISGLIITSAYIINFKFLNVHLNSADNWFFGISPEGFGFVGMIINFIVALIVSFFFTKPPDDIYRMVDKIRQP
jgi:cation/acetate symporter